MVVSPASWKHNEEQESQSMEPVLPFPGVGVSEH